MYLISRNNLYWKIIWKKYIKLNHFAVLFNTILYITYTAIFKKRELVPSFQQKDCLPNPTDCIK